MNLQDLISENPLLFVGVTLAIIAGAIIAALLSKPQEAAPPLDNELRRGAVRKEYVICSTFDNYLSPWAVLPGPDRRENRFKTEDEAAEWIASYYGSRRDGLIPRFYILATWTNE